MAEYYILEGHEPKKSDLFSWGYWLESANVNDRRVNRTKVGIPAWKYWMGKLLKIKQWEPVLISTVFLGLDHRFGEGPPLLFETMVFGGKHHQEIDRYSTWDEAEKGHAKFVKLIKNN